MKRLIILTVFGVAMAFFEAAVVIYLREIIYPEGFSFPLRPVPEDLVLTELLRETSTILMLITAAMLFGKRLKERLAAFIIAFAVWDIGYYIFLKTVLDWPAGMLSWDILFLIPAPWTGPVLAPVINSLTMILMGLVLLMKRIRLQGRIAAHFWLLVIIGSLVTITAYIMPWASHMLHEYTLADIIRMSDEVVFSEHAVAFVPEQFPWLVFLAGEALFLIAIGRLLKR